MNNRASHAKILDKIWWSLALFINVLLTIQAIFTHNIPGCITVILFGLYIAKFGDPIIFEKYNKQREAKYQKACEKRKQYRAKIEKDKIK